MYDELIERLNEMLKVEGLRFDQDASLSMRTGSPTLFGGGAGAGAAVSPLVGKFYFKPTSSLDPGAQLVLDWPCRVKDGHRVLRFLQAVVKTIYPQVSVGVFDDGDPERRKSPTKHSLYITKLPVDVEVSSIQDSHIQNAQVRISQIVAGLPEELTTEETESVMRLRQIIPEQLRYLQFDREQHDKLSAYSLEYEKVGGEWIVRLTWNKHLHGDILIDKFEEFFNVQSEGCVKVRDGEGAKILEICLSTSLKEVLDQKDIWNDRVLGLYRELAILAGSLYQIQEARRGLDPKTPVRRIEFGRRG